MIVVDHTLMGGLVGGAIGAASYGLSDAAKWQTHKTVLDYAGKQNSDAALLRGARYVAANEGFDVSGGFDLTAGGSNYNYNEDKLYLNKRDRLSNGKVDPSKFYSTVAHEVRHQPLQQSKSVLQWNAFRSFNPGEFGLAQGAQERIINNQFVHNRFFDYWSPSTQDFIMQRHNEFAAFFYSY